MPNSVKMLIIESCEDCPFRRDGNCCFDGGPDLTVGTVEYVNECHPDCPLETPTFKSVMNIPLELTEENLKDANELTSGSDLALGLVASCIGDKK